MDTIQSGVITLMKSAITGQSYSLPADFDLTAAYKLMKRHTVLALGYAGACNCGFEKNSPVMQQLYRAYCVSALVSERQLTAASQIFDAFEAHKIPFMPVKGCNLKFLYPSPCLRSMGDADILIHPEQMEEIRPIMESLGFEEIQDTDPEWVWNSKALHVELHKRLFAPHNSDYFEYYGDGWRLAKKADGYHYYMTDEDQFLYILTHFAKHYRGAGIGLSHLLDLWICIRSCPDMDFAYIEHELSCLDLLEFYTNIRELINEWFFDAPLTEKSDFIAQYIMNNGVWGTQENSIVANSLKDTQKTKSLLLTKMLRIVHGLFPKKNQLKQRYPIVEKHPILLPMVWIWRWFDALLFRRKNISNNISSIKMMSKSNLQTRKDALNYVGIHLPPVE